MPQIDGGPEALNKLLESAYQSCMTGGGDETSCSKQAWGAAKDAGWQEKGGEWVKETALSRLDNVEIFAAGEWEGSGGRSKWTEADLDEIVTNYMETREKLKPHMKLGHDDKQKLLQRDGYPAAGWITALKRVGKKLVATIDGIPGKIADLIKRSAYGRFSAEIFRKIKIDGKELRNVLSGVALLGADTPAVDSLDDFINLYGVQCEKIQFTGDAPETFEREVISVDNIEITKEEYGRLQKAEILADNFSKKIDELQGQVDEFTAKIAEQETVIKKYQEKEVELYSKEVDLAIDPFVTDSTITPAEGDFYKTIARKNHDDFDAVKKLLEGKRGAGQVAEYAQTATKHTEVQHKSSGVEDEGEFIDRRANEIVAEFSKRGEKISYKEACIAAGREFDAKKGE